MWVLRCRINPPDPNRVCDTVHAVHTIQIVVALAHAGTGAHPMTRSPPGDSCPSLFEEIATESEQLMKLSEALQNLPQSIFVRLIGCGKPLQ
jgi:hypothetical protein